jgi:drug/metabolite transporter (DMT)-like permease
MSPAITIALSFFLLKERTGKFGVLGILCALCALPLFDYSSGEESVNYGLWFVLAVGVLLAWGIQAYFIKLANATMDAESIFFYMMLGGLLTIPVALLMTDFSQPINTNFNGPYLAAITQILNSIGALLLVYAFRYGKALVVSPMVNAGAPLLTTIISLAIAGSMPSDFKLAGIALSLCAALLLALQPEEPQSVPLTTSR